ncbi:helix-turn-helix domain-containing protein [Polaribacter sp. IC073]|uniref:helix-turn-helix domain-containing protein n=1 Tax=Polaribacter sp. IC073 TaxID=2508540 RepID=UPI0011BEE06F|nr:helix-turn-helix transcriptional regulator [Polaribacter sp. IC073]TXD47348.1 helix-turn-helix transcriptional regulator [Polaribacter sp. IC073]
MTDISSMKRVHTNIDLLMDKQEIKTDKEFAVILGWTPSAFSQRVNGKLSIGTLETIADYFGITVKELLR